MQMRTKLVGRSIPTQVPVRLAALTAVAAISSTVRADILAPTDLQPGDKFNLVFVTQATTGGSDPNIGTYDTLVQLDATSAGLSTFMGQTLTWSALASTADGTTAVTRFNPSSPIFRLDGLRVADNGSDLWDGSIQNPLDITSAGSLTSAAVVWTGSAADGTAASTTVGPKSLGAIPPVGIPITSAETGQLNATDGTWIADSTTFQSDQNPVYAFSNELIYVPEPTTAAVAGLAALAALSARRRPRT